jgi:hypothetical protein
LSIGLLGSNPKVFGIIHANPHSKMLMYIAKRLMPLFQVARLVVAQRANMG